MKKAWFNILSPGILLVLVTIFSLATANSLWGDTYRNFWNTYTPSVSGLHLPHTVLHWVNDCLMAIFFLLVGLEIRREVLEGELKSPSKAMLPVFAAIGGMMIPAVIYYGFTKGTDAVHGWGIPTATDIAFALAVLSMLKNRVPGGVRIFLTALAIMDDLGAVLIIALFYSGSLLPGYLAGAAVIVLILFLMNKFKVRKMPAYLIMGAALWYFVLNSGVHATIAGVMLALFIPAEEINYKSLLHSLEHALIPWVNYLILPVFAIANTAMLIDARLMDKIFSAPALGIMIGLILGKPFGITLFSYIAVRLKLAELPSRINFKHIAGAGMLGGIGFTMSIFISMLAFDSPEMQDLARMSILIASLFAGIAGYIWMLKTGKRKETIKLPSTG